MTDAHTHILPCMDDGSKSVSMSAEMLWLLKRQGADMVFATPHFYSDQDSPNDFLSRREKSVEKLSDLISGGFMPKIRLGAEVRWYSGMSRTSEIEELLIEGTRLLMVEMPFTDWKSYMIQELRELQSRGINPVLAHVDRYPCFRRKHMLTELNEYGLYLQVNASATENLFASMKVKWMMKNRLFQFLGTDCHNMDDRSPNLESAVNKLRRECDEQIWEDFVNLNDDLTGGE